MQIFIDNKSGAPIYDQIYTQLKNQIISGALKENEIPDFQAEVLSLDQNAFIIYSESQQIVGKGFRVYR